MAATHVNLNDLDGTIEKLERIKKLLEDIKRLQESIEPYSVGPEPVPYIPQPSRTTDPMPAPPYKIWCSADDLRKRRKSLGLTIQEVSDNTGVSYGTVWNYEHGRSDNALKNKYQQVMSFYDQVEKQKVIL